MICLDGIRLHDGCDLLHEDAGVAFCPVALGCLGWKLYVNAHKFSLSWDHHESPML